MGFPPGSGHGCQCSPVVQTLVAVDRAGPPRGEVVVTGQGAVRASEASRQVLIPPVQQRTRFEFQPPPLLETAAADRVIAELPHPTPHLRIQIRPLTSQKRQISTSFLEVSFSREKRGGGLTKQSNANTETRFRGHSCMRSR